MQELGEAEDRADREHRDEVRGPADEAAARAVMDADPAVLAGVMVYEIRALRPVFDVARDVRTEGSVSTLSEAEPGRLEGGSGRAGQA